MSRGDLYDAASTVVAQKLSQVEGIGEVGAAAVRCLRPRRISFRRQSTNTVSAWKTYGGAVQANAHSPKGGIDVGDQRYQIYANDQANKAVDYHPCCRLPQWRRDTSVRYRRGHRRRGEPAYSGLANGNLRS